MPRYARPTHRPERGIDHPDDRSIVLGLEQVLDVRHFLHHPRDVEFTFDVADDLLRRPVRTGISL